MPPPTFPNLTVLSHPLIQHKLSILRDKHTSTRDFKQLVGEIATLMAYEVTKDLATQPVEVETPLERTTGRQVAGKKLTLVPILRAGLGMVDGITQLIPRRGWGTSALSGSSDASAVDYYFRSRTTKGTGFFILDPFSPRVPPSPRRRPEKRPELPHPLPLPRGCPEGVRRMLDNHPRCRYSRPRWTASSTMSGNPPGLGDAGDRLVGTR